MYRNIRPIALLVVALVWITQASGQGCVAIKSFTTCDMNAFTNSNLMGKGWVVSTNYRYFRSFRHFSGTEESTGRFDHVNADGSVGNEVINYVTQLNVGMAYDLNKRNSIYFVLPWSYNTRSSLYEHGNKSRHSMRSVGIGDIRVGVQRWLFDPDSTRKGNLALGVGIKLPTGNFNAMDFAYDVHPQVDTNGTVHSGEYRPVDQSIQLGDGGFGFTLELQGFAKLFGPVFGYINGFYLFNPMETNGTRTYRETLNPILSNEAICSVPDQYMARLGLDWNISRKIGLNMFCGGRLEGIPVEDLIGGSEGFRRPGYVISLEPGLDWMRGRHDVNLSVPVAMVRDRTQSVTDKETQAATGKPRHGDAAFADYLINISWSVRLGNGHPF
ncbi:MAG: hypothetical protein H6594_02095 [Flavobacteriales bacterium]|nr:hypothetical protein [Flavobacteriales bacterium]